MRDRAGVWNLPGPFGYARRPIVLAATGLMLAIGSLAAPAGLSGATTIVVGGACSLPDAIAAANTDTDTGGCPAGSGADTIVLEAGATYFYGTAADDPGSFGASALPALASDLTIEGNGATIERSSAAGTPLFRVLRVSGNVTIRNLTVRNGFLGAPGDLGGGILVDDYANLLLEQVTVAGNTAQTGGGIAVRSFGWFDVRGSTITGNTATNGHGGGIYNEGNFTPLVDSTVSDNVASQGGGGLYQNPGPSRVFLSIGRSTFSGNRAAFGGGIAVNGTPGSGVSIRTSTISGNLSVATGTPYSGGGGVFALYPVGLANSTVVDNRSTDPAHAGGLMTAANTASFGLNDTIVLGNSSGGNPNAPNADCEVSPAFGGLLESFGFNLVPFGTGCPQGQFNDVYIVVPGDLSSVLGPLALNPPGTTATHALPPGSPAIDAGGPGPQCTLFGVGQDQRGVVRPIGAACDIGAYEAGPAAANQPPIATPDAYAVDEDTTLNVPAATGVLANDADPDGDPLTAAVVAGPAHGVLVLNPDGSFSYTPAANFFGTDSFTYMPNDGKANGNVATVTITVSDVNDPPQPLNDAGVVDQGSAAGVLVDVLANDTPGPNEAGQTLTITGVGAPAHGTAVVESGKIRYTPEAGYSGPDSFTYTVTDNGTTHGAPDPKTATASVEITVKPSPADLSLTLTGSVARPPLGSQETLTATLRNDGPGDTTGVAAHVTLPPTVQLVTATPGAGTYDAGTGTWSVVALAANAAATLELVVKVVDGSPDDVVAEVTASGKPDPDSTPGNGNPLEDDYAKLRVTPYGIWVNSNAEAVDPADGSCTLVEAFTAANTDSASGPGPRECAPGAGADTIYLQQNQTYLMTSPSDSVNTYGIGVPNITGDVDVQGRGSTIQRVSGSPQFRLVRVSAGVTASFADLTLRNGLLGPGGCGGALVSAGRVTMMRVTVSGNGIDGTGGSSTSEGGGLCNLGALTMIDSTVENNSVSTTTAGYAAYGGGIYSSTGGPVPAPSLDLVGCRLQGNVVQAFNDAFGYGGGVFTSSTDVHLTRTTVEGNVVAGAAGTTPHGGGGLAFVGGTAASISDGSAVDGNSASGGGGGVLVGGATTVTVAGGTIGGNRADGTWYGPGAGGGGLANYAPGNVTLDGVTLTGNTSPNGDGGGIYNSGTLTFRHGQLAGNTALSGGALGNGSGAFEGGTATMVDTVAHDNVASSYAGGALSAYGGNLTLDHVTVQDNRAARSGGGLGLFPIGNSPGKAVLNAVSVQRNTATYDGGISNYADTTLTGGDVSGNTAARTGGGIANGNVLTATRTSITGNTAGGDGGGLVMFGAATTTTLDHVSVTGNNVMAGNGGGIANGFIDAAGNLVPGGQLTVSKSSVDSNRTTPGLWVNVVTGWQGGGGVCAFGGTTRLDATSVSGNVVDTPPGWVFTGGGGVLAGGHTSQPTRLEIVGGSTIDANIVRGPSRFGGGIGLGFVTTLVMDGSLLERNDADYGGGAYMLSASATVSDSTIDSNSASAAGGGLSVAFGSTLTIGGSSVTDNRAAGSSDVGGGGGISNGSDLPPGSVVLNGVTVRGNQSPDGFGGGIFNRGTLTVRGSGISENKALSGGGVANGSGAYKGGEVTVETTEFRGNASSNGGGLANFGGGVTVKGSTLTANEAVFIGGGLSTWPFGADRGTVRLEATSVTANSSLFNGGISSYSDLTLAGGDVSGNVAASTGGGIANGWRLTATGTSISGNTAGGDGGGILQFGPESATSLEDVTISANHVTSGSGGGIANGIDLVPAIPGGTLSLRHTTVRSNVVTPASPSLVAGGGGISALGGMTSVVGSTIDANLVQDPLTPLVAAGGGIMGGVSLDLPTPVTVSGNSTVSNNTVTYSSAKGGGVSQVGSTLTVADSVVTGNRANQGGGIFNFWATVSVFRSHVDGNDALKGGGISAWNGATILDATSVAGNSVADSPYESGSGGGVAASLGGSLVVRNGSTISGNTADGHSGGGGVVNESPARLTVMDSTIAGNRATNGPAGGIWNAGTALVERSTISRNVASDSAGGIENAFTPGGFGPRSLTLVGSTVSDNTVSSAGGFGGGIYNQEQLTLTQSTISGNRSTDGGGIANDGEASITNSTISGNGSAALAGSGGAIRNRRFLTVSLSTIAGNAAGAAGGIMSSGGDVSYTQTILAGNRSNDPAFAGNADCRSTAGTLTSVSYNLTGLGTGCPAAGTGGVTVDPNQIFSDVLLPLADNGGGTFTHALQPGSPALDAAGACAAVDQRNLPRPKDGDGDGAARCDIGALEEQLPLPGLKALSLSPARALAGGPAFPLAVNGTGFVAGAVVQWNGVARATSVLSPTLLTATIPAGDLATGADVATALVTVVLPGGKTSKPLPFTIVSPKVASVQSSTALPGQAAIASSGSTGPAVWASLVNNGAGTPAATVTAATYSTNPTTGSIFAGGGFVDLQVAGADPTDTVAARFYYPSSVTGAIEVNLQLQYWTGAGWALVRTSGGAAPAKDTTDNLDATVSGGRFSVAFDSTSTPKVTQLAGTIIVATANPKQMIVALIRKTQAFLNARRDGEDELEEALEAAGNALEPKKKASVCRALSRYIRVVSAAPKKVLSPAQKAELVADATAITIVVGCG